jgi:hypothetical protein
MERGTLFLLGQSEHLARQLARRIVPRSEHVKDPEATQRREQQFRAIHDLRAQLAGPVVDGFRGRRGKALDGMHGGAKACLQGQLLPYALGGLRHRFKQLQRLREALDRFRVGRALDGAFTSLLPVDIACSVMPAPA